MGTARITGTGSTPHVALTQIFGYCTIDVSSIFSGGCCQHVGLTHDCVPCCFLLACILGGICVTIQGAVETVEKGARFDGGSLGTLHYDKSSGEKGRAKSIMLHVGR